MATVTNDDAAYAEFTRLLDLSLDWLSQCTGARLIAGTKHARRELTIAKHRKVAALWKAGLTTKKIAQELGIRRGSMSSYVDLARRALGHGALYRRRQVRRPDPSPLDKLQAVGDYIIVPHHHFDRHSNAHDKAAIRGWRITVTKTGDGWGVTAIARIPTRAEVKREKQQALAAA